MEEAIENEEEADLGMEEEIATPRYSDTEKYKVLIASLCPI